MSVLAPTGYAGYCAHTRARTTGTLVVLVAARLDQYQKDRAG